MKSADFISQMLNRTVRGSKGYTLDQTILIVAIIAILVTLIIITVGWNILNRASGTKLAAQFRQVEDANNQFYSQVRQWPDSVFSTPPTTPKDGNVVVLASLTPTGAALATSVVLDRNYLSGFTATATNVQHTFSTGGLVEQLTVTGPAGFPATSRYLIVQFTAVPFSQVQQAEFAIDGQANENYTRGRILSYRDTSGDCMTAALAAGNAATAATNGGTLVNACYVANNVQ